VPGAEPVGASAAVIDVGPYGDALSLRATSDSSSRHGEHLATWPSNRGSSEVPRLPLTNAITSSGSRHRSSGSMALVE
jgi:hypothetical protein